ncbi:16S rRNA processing protein RimM [Clostridium sp. 19966]|uniref:ribosome maturation factor RimM n=1 Tax=Clostridium sp. 19966 TaxID=2768166 RepID=UPI0028DDAB9C|nr:ribosome maturation factor RimM [Clostridium sp. 19966]MDT8716443.1 16S rRNA processing protein RimM [Clostridium sp. 19966]
MKDILTIGQIINTHGVKGELKIYPLTDDIKRFKKLKRVFVNDIERKVVWVKLQSDKVILKLEGIDTMEQANELKSSYLTVNREDATKLPEGRYYVVDIVGCKVIDTNGKLIGKVDEVVFTGSNDVYWIKGEKDILIPAIADVVLNIDIEKEEILIKPVEVWNYED